MTGLLIAPVLSAVLALGQQPARPPQDIVADIKAQIAVLNDRVAELEAAIGPKVTPASELQAALGNGGDLYLDPGAIYPLSILITKPTRLHCRGAGFVGEKRIPEVPAIDIQASHVRLEDCGAATEFADAVIRIGHNDSTQTHLEQIPTDVVFVNVHVPSHHRKRAIEINGEFDGAGLDLGPDIYSKDGFDSQAIAVLNSCGRVFVRNSRLGGASEGFLVGGDTLKLPCEITDVQLTDSHVYVPLAYQNDGVKRKLKTRIEVKRGNKVLVKNVTADGSWNDGQDGWAFTVTPRNAGEIHDVLFEDVTATNVGGGFNITGADDKTVTPAATSGFVARRVRVTTNATLYGGRGEFALIGTEPADLTFEDCIGTVDGTKVFEYAFGSRLLADGTTRKTGKLGALTITGGRYLVGKFGISFAGQQNGANLGLSVGTWTITGNTFAGALTAFQKNLPGNSFIDKAAF